MKLIHYRSVIVLMAFTIAIVRLGSSASVPSTSELKKQIEQVADNPRLAILGTNNNDEIPESSGLAASSIVENEVWTINDSSHPNELYLLKTTGKIVGRVRLVGAKNVDWEAMAGFQLDGGSYLAVADVGDNRKRRSKYQIYLLPEPKLSESGKTDLNLSDVPVEKQVRPKVLEFTYPDGAKDCEAIAVDVSARQIWLVEKVHLNEPRSISAGIYVLPFKVAKPDQPRVARRIADFPVRYVTGMAFSDDGKHLIIRNYLSAHLYSRNGTTSWEEVVTKTKPKTVVLPLQRQGEAICFSPDSRSVILTSEKVGQPIWRVSLKPYIDSPADNNGKPDDLKSRSK